MRRTYAKCPTKLVYISKPFSPIQVITAVLIYVHVPFDAPYPRSRFRTRKTTDVTLPEMNHVDTDVSDEEECDGDSGDKSHPSLRCAQQILLVAPEVCRH